MISENSFVQGLIVSGDTFISEPDEVNKIISNFSEVKAVEMEGASIAHTCYLFKVPFIIIRSLSDIAGKNNVKSFEEHLHKASLNSSNLILRLLEPIRNKTLVNSTGIVT